MGISNVIVLSVFIFSFGMVFGFVVGVIFNIYNTNKHNSETISDSKEHQWTSVQKNVVHGKIITTGSVHIGDK